MHYQVEQSTFGKFPVTSVKDTQTGAELRFSHQGALLLNYWIPLKEKLYDIIDGFATPEELETQGGARMVIMAPFANRIPEGTYTFNGETHTIVPVNPLYQKVRHGFLKDIEFNLSVAKEFNHSFVIEFTSSDIRPGKFPGYPFSLDVFVRYIWSGKKLTIEVGGLNAGDKPLPFWVGWHAYFKPSPNGVDDLELSLPAQTLIKADSNEIPLPGNEAYVPVDHFPDKDFRKVPFRKINKQAFDLCYGHLDKDHEGWSTCRLFAPDTGIQISMFQESGFVVLFTGDTLKYRPRNSVAIEPMQCPTNAFNREDCQAEITLQPGQSTRYIFGMTYQVK